MPITVNSTMTMFADDTAVMAENYSQLQTK
jgi:hypothetical protein